MTIFTTIEKCVSVGVCVWERERERERGERESCILTIDIREQRSVATIKVSNHAEKRYNFSSAAKNDKNLVSLI